MWASGARSPLAPTDPRDGTTGCTPALSIATSASSVSTPDARIALGQHVRAQRHRRPHRPDRQRRPEPGRVAPQEVPLQRLERIGRDRDLGERSEPGVDAVHRLVPEGLPFNDRARRGHTCESLRRDATGSPRSAIAVSCSIVSEEPVRRIIGRA